MSTTEDAGARADAETSLDALGVRDAAALETQGVRDAATLATEGRRTAEALTAAGQRRISGVWEVTQALIAVSTVFTVLGLAMRAMEIPQVLQNMVFLIIGFYFSRTNHEKVGGTGTKPDAAPYTGR